MHASILVPFDDLRTLQGTLSQALAMAEHLSAEVVLLRVNLPVSSRLDPSQEACLYSELKALQAQCAAYDTAIRIETMQGPAEQAIISFAAEQDIDLIFTGQIGQILGRKGPDAAAFGVPWQRAARQPAMRSAGAVRGNVFDAIGGLGRTRRAA